MDRISCLYVFVFTVTVLPFPPAFYYISGTEIGNTSLRFLVLLSLFSKIAKDLLNTVH